MLDHFYAKFDKAYYSGLCKAVAVGEDIYIMGKMCFEEFVKIISRKLFNSFRHGD